MEKDGNKDLMIAELIGAHIGDGTLYKTSWSIVWELRGALEEKEYYTEHIVPLLKNIFGIEIVSKFRSGGANGVWGVQTSNKSISNFFIDNGFNPGTKTYTVEVPNFIQNSDVNTKRAFVRGLFDTDGCLRFDKLKGQTKHTYPRMEFSSASVKLRDSLNLLLKNLGFRTFIWNDGTDNFRLCINGKIMLEKWITEIRPENPKHLKKYHQWKEKGYYIPKHVMGATVA